MKILNRFILAVLASPLVASAHPGHSAFDPFAGPPHGGHEVEYLLLVLPVLGVIAAAVRAYKQRGD